jgi:hypothetical protein
MATDFTIFSADNILKIIEPEILDSLGRFAALVGN